MVYTVTWNKKPGSKQNKDKNKNNVIVKGPAVSFKNQRNVTTYRLYDFSNEVMS